MAELVWAFIGAVAGGTAVLVLVTFAVEKATERREAYIKWWIRNRRSAK